METMLQEKITKITDASGTITYKYGKIGETTEEMRTLSVKNGTVGETMTATTGYTSNYLGQMEQVSYPDGEKVGYGYDAGGQVTSVIGNHYGHDFVYVSDIGYDEFGQRTYIEYGTGLRTDYEYDENRGWLSSIKTAKSQKKYQNISYSFDLVGNVLGYTNDCSSGSGYTTSQTYSYDSLYQLVSASGSTRYEPVTGGVVPEHESTYTQSFNFDILGNMTTKTSVETVYPEKTIGDALNYSIDFSYAEGFAHRLDHAGDRYYSYDDDGNVVRERNEAMTDSSGTDTGSDDDEWDDWDDWDDDWGDGLGEAGFGFGMGGSGSGSDSGSGSGGQATVYERIYEWDERDRLTGSTEGNTVVGYVYGEDGNRTNKYSSVGETLYFSSMWTWHDAKSLGSGGQTTKNIYLGTERIVSKLNRGEGLDTYSEEYHKTYYWHSDHLGSAHFITDYQGNEYQRIEYTPYGEEWIELKSDSGDQYLPYKFTGKERDEETGLYYYGARYLDPVYSRWLSTDPAIGEYLPTVGADNSNLPGMGGVFNTMNLCLYTYAINNPIMYTDPDGNEVTFENFKKLYEISKGFWEMRNNKEPDYFRLQELVDNFLTLTEKNPEYWGITLGLGAVAGLGLLAYNKSEFLQDAVSSTKEYINLLSKELEYIFHPIEFSNGIIIDKNTIYYIPNNNININISLSPISIKKITFLANANLERYLCKNVFFSAFLNTTVAIPLQKEIEKKDVVVSFVGAVSVSWRF